MNTPRTALSVNLNKVALVRNTRHLGIPSVTKAATLCLKAGANGITVHPRPDERHIRAHDVRELAALMQAWPDREYNIEGNPFHNLMDCLRDLVERKLPVHQVTFVPDSQGQFTSDHGWSFPQDLDRLRPVIAQAKALGVRVSLFMDADASAMAQAKAVGADRVELYTEPYAAAWGTPQQASELARFAQAVQVMPGVAEVSIGHALIADALELGYSATVRDYLRCIQEGQAQASAGAQSA